MALLTKDEILAADDLKSEIVSCPEWGGDVRVKSLTGTQRDKFEESLAGDGEKRNLANMRARLVAWASVGEDGKPLFTQEDVAALGAKSAAALDRCFQAIKTISGIGEDATDNAKKNSPAPAADLLSGSPGI